MKAWLERVRFLVRPPARRPRTLRTAFPMLVFVALVPATWWTLEALGVLALARWTPLLLLLLAPWIWWVAEASTAGLGPGRARLALALRAACCWRCSRRCSPSRARCAPTRA
jgi:hypothetical protein